jgi:hypothetical protein
MSQLVRKSRHIAFAIVLFISAPIQARADIFKWINKEALPTIKGQKPINIKPYISVKSDVVEVKLGKDAAMIKVGPVTVQTSKLRLRLAQAACTYATGDIYTCAPDVINREARKLFTQVANGIEPNSDLANSKPPSPKPTPPKPTGSGLTFSDLDATEVPWGPPDVSVGFDFSNPGMASTGKPTPSGFLHSFAIARAHSPTAGDTVEIVGRADFAFMDGQQGGILCLFATQKGKYLKDHNGKYSGPYGLVAIGSSTTITQSPTLIPIQLSLPWSELELPDDDDPFQLKFVKCYITVNGTESQETDWVPF